MAESQKDLLGRFAEELIAPLEAQIGPNSLLCSVDIIDAIVKHVRNRFGELDIASIDQRSTTLSVILNDTMESVPVIFPEGKDDTSAYEIPSGSIQVGRTAAVGRGRTVASPSWGVTKGDIQ